MQLDGKVLDHALHVRARQQTVQRRFGVDPDEARRKALEVPERRDSLQPCERSLLDSSEFAALVGDLRGPVEAAARREGHAVRMIAHACVVELDDDFDALSRAERVQDALRRLPGLSFSRWMVEERDEKSEAERERERERFSWRAPESRVW